MLKKIADIVIKSLVVITIILGLLTFFKPELIKTLVEGVRGIVETLGYWNYVIIFLSALIEAFPVIGVVVPGQNFMIIVGGFFGSQGQESLIYSIIFASLGAITGNYIGYILGISYGKDFFEKYGLWFGIGKTELRYLESGVKKWGAFSIILGKFHNLARAFVPFIAGSMGMKNGVFFLYNIIGSIIRSIFFIVIGVIFSQYYEIVIDYIGYFFLALMIGGALYIYLFKKEAFMQYMREKNQEIEEQIEQKSRKK